MSGMPLRFLGSPLFWVMLTRGVNKQRTARQPRLARSSLMFSEATLCSYRVTIQMYRSHLGRSAIAGINLDFGQDNSGMDVRSRSVCFLPCCSVHLFQTTILADVTPHP